MANDKASRGIQMRKYALILFIFLILIISLNVKADAAISFYIGNREVDIAPAHMIAKNGHILIPVYVLADYMGADVETDSNNDIVIIKFPSHLIEMQLGSTDVLVNGEVQIMDIAPERSNNETLIPLRFIVDLLGMRLSFDSKSAAIFVTLSPEIADWVTAHDEGGSVELELPDFFDPEVGETIGTPVIKEIVFMGGPRSRVFIDIDGHVAYESFLLTNPDRMVIDLTGVTYDESLSKQIINNTIVQTIRCDQFDSRTVRIVFDLNNATDYEIHRWPGGGLEVEFNYQISDIGYYKGEDQMPRIWFESNEQPTFSVQLLPSPMRLVLDFQDTTLLSGARELQISDPPVRAIRVSQNTPSVTRIVLDLESAMIPISVVEVDGRYEILLFKGTESEYQATLVEEPEIIEPEIVVPHEIETSDDLLLARRIIVIDPGHGGSDPGTIGTFLGTYEKDVVLPISLKFGELLEEHGAIVVYTRTEDNYVSLFDRPQIAEMVNAELFISIHANSYEGTVARGVETLYNPLYLENFRLAQMMQNELVSHLGVVNRGVRPRTDLLVLNNSTMPAVLMEVGFVSHQEEELLLIDPDYQNEIAIGLLNGVLAFFDIYR